MTKSNFSVILIILFSLFFGYGCKSQKLARANISIFTPIKNQKYTLGSDIPIQLSYNNKKDLPKSIDCKINGQLVLTTSEIQNIICKNPSDKTGSADIEVSATYNDNRIETVKVQVIVLADKAPTLYKYKVNAVYPHDTKAYTQGLLFDDEGNMYESTGSYGLSTVRKVDFRTGEVLQKTNLPNTYFGEGLVLLNDTLYQLTWNEHVSIVYNKSDLSEIKKLKQPTKEGWGITYDGTNFLISDGSSHIYFVDPISFKELYKIDVCDNKQRVIYLNELEYIEGKIFANIYQTDRIAIIDPQTGAVEGYIQCEGLLKDSDKNDNTDVLNGIAYSKKDRKLYITGKNWPKLFEISYY